MQAQSLQKSSLLAELEARAFGLRIPSEWRLHCLPDIPGLLLITNPFLSSGQHAWVKRCLEEYPRRPNVCNLDAHLDREGDGSLWPPQWNSETLNTPAKKPKLAHASSGLKVIPKDSLLYRLRWVTLGYHYNWTTKEYSEDKRSPFPEELACLSAFIMSQAGFPG